VVNDASIGRITACVGDPCILPIVIGWNDQQAGLFQLLSESSDGGPIRAARCGIAAFKHDECRGQHRAPLREHVLIYVTRHGMGFGIHIPIGNHSCRIEKNGRHG
jgi:hypothetical protein